jgi:hypothetical protein
MSRAATRELRVAWVISGDRSRASSRLQGFLIHEWMERHGVASSIAAVGFDCIQSVWDRRFIEIAVRLRRSAPTHVVFESPGWIMRKLARLCSLWGHRVIAVRADRIPTDYDTYYDLTITPTEGLRRELGIVRGAVIDDLVEVPADKCKRSYEARDERLRVVWVGHEGYEEYIVGLVQRLRAVPEISGRFDFELISSGPFATRQWSEATVVEDVLDSDIALLPLPDGVWYRNKSSNRLAMMFSLGMPVVATLIPSYAELARHSINGLFVRHDDEIAACLLDLTDARRRESLGREARRGLGDAFRVERIGPRWVEAIASAEPVNPARRRFAPRIRAYAAWIALLAYLATFSASVPR